MLVSPMLFDLVCMQQCHASAWRVADSTSSTKDGFLWDCVGFCWRVGRAACADLRMQNLAHSMWSLFSHLYPFHLRPVALGTRFQLLELGCRPFDLLRQLFLLAVGGLTSHVPIFVWSLDSRPKLTFCWYTIALVSFHSMLVALEVGGRRAYT